MLNGNGSRDGSDGPRDRPSPAPRYPPVQRRSPSTALASPASQPSGAGHHHSSSSGGGGGYNNHHHHGQQQMHRKGGSIKEPHTSPPRGLRTVDRPGHGTGSRRYKTSQIQRPSRPISPASTSTTALLGKTLADFSPSPMSHRKRLVAVGAAAAVLDLHQKRPSPASAPSAAPPQPSQPKISKSPSFPPSRRNRGRQVLLADAAVPLPSQAGEHESQAGAKDAPENESGNSSPAPSSSGVRPADSASLTTTAPKRKRPRLVKYDNENRPSPAKPDTAEPPSRQEVLPVPRSDAKPSVSAVAESGASTTAAASATAGAQQEATREQRRGGPQRKRSRAPGQRIRSTGSRAREPGRAASATSQADSEAAAPVGSEARNGRPSRRQRVSWHLMARQEKFCIDLMKGLDSEMDVAGRNSEKKDDERSRRGLEINLEDDKAQRIRRRSLLQRLTLQLDLEKPSQRRRESYIAPVPGLSAPGLHHPMDIKPGTSAGLQHPALPPLPERPKRCATHCYIAQQIQYHQRLTKMNFWPPAAAAAAAAAASRSAPFFGPRGPFNMGVVPPAEAASLLANPMQGGYPVRAQAPLQETKTPSMVSSPFQGSLSKDKGASSSATVAESNQRKQPPAHEAQQSSSPMPPNLMQPPTFIFPFNQHAAAVAAATAAANRMGDTKSSGASSAMPSSSATAHASAAHPGASAMNLSFANLQPGDAQFLAILQNGYPFQVAAAHAGGPPSYRGMAPQRRRCTVFQRACLLSPHIAPITAASYAATKSSRKNPMPSLSGSSQKHQPQQSQGLLGYAPNANAAAAAAAAAAANSSQSYSSGNQRPVLLPGLAHRQDTDKTLQDGQSSDDKSAHHQKGGYEHNFAIQCIFRFCKSNDHHQQPSTSRTRGSIDLASSQPFVMPFGAPGSAPSGLDFSSLAQNHALFQSHQEAGRHGYPQLNFAAAHAGDNERKKSASAKYPSDLQQHSLSFSKPENKSFMHPFLGSSANEPSVRTLSLIGAESSNAFGLGQQIFKCFYWSSFVSCSPICTNHLPAATPPAAANSAAAAATPSPADAATIPAAATSAAAAVPTAATSAAATTAAAAPAAAAPAAATTAAPAKYVTPSETAAAAIVSKSSELAPGLLHLAMQVDTLATSQGVPGQSPQLKASSMRVSAPPSAASIGHSLLIFLRRRRDLSRSSNAPVASGSPSNSVSKSTGGSPPASGSHEGWPASCPVSSPQQHAAKNSPCDFWIQVSLHKSLQQYAYTIYPWSAAKHAAILIGHFFISNALAPPQGPPQHVNAGAGAGLYQKRSTDKAQQQQQNAVSATIPADAGKAAGSNMKANLHPAAGGFMHLATAGQSASGSPHSHMSGAQLAFSMPMPVKPTSDQKPAA
ncbi:hypothetical protein ZWY2020_020499, partial [Hordeum vulgare]